MKILWAVMAVILLVVVIRAIIEQMQFKKNGIKVMAHIMGYQEQNGQQFAHYFFNYEGTDYTICDYFADDHPAPDTDREVLFLPNKPKYVMREESTSIKLWQIGGIIAAAVLLVIEVMQLTGIGK